MVYKSIFRIFEWLFLAPCTSIYFFVDFTTVGLEKLKRCSYKHVKSDSSQDQNKYAYFSKHARRFSKAFIFGFSGSIIELILAKGRSSSSDLKGVGIIAIVHHCHHFRDITSQICIRKDGFQSFSEFLH